MFTSFTPDLSFGGYGYGWAIDQHFEHQRIGHGGAINGFRASISRYPKSKATIIVLSNRENADPEGITSTIAARLLSKQ